MGRPRIWQERAAFLGYDARCRESLKELRPLLAGAMGGLLEDFYRFMRTRPETRELLPTGEVSLRAQKAQGEHWLQLLSGGELDEAHYARAVQIGHTHERIGLGLSAYLGGYCIMLNRFTGLLAAHGQDTPEALAEKLEALQKAVFLDIDFVIESYLDAKNGSIRKILRSAEHFIGEVERLESELAGSGAGLGPAAEALAAELGECRGRLAALRQALPGAAASPEFARLEAGFAACAGRAAAAEAKWRVFSGQLERLSGEVAARRERHHLNFGPPAPGSLPARLKNAWRALFPPRP